MLACFQQARAACCSIAVPIRIALCTPLLICTLNGYTTNGALQSVKTYPVSNSTGSQDGLQPDKADPDATDGMVSSTARLLSVYIVSPPSSCRGRALAIAFVILALGFSLASLMVTWILRVSDPEYLGAGVDHKMAVADGLFAEGRMGTAKGKWRLWNLCIGVGTRLLLSALGTTAFVEILAERNRVKPEFFVAIEGLGWTIVTMLYLGVINRIFILMCDLDDRRLPAKSQKDGACGELGGSAASLEGKEMIV